jgi:hypothetical protein
MGIRRSSDFRHHVARSVTILRSCLTIIVSGGVFHAQGRGPTIINSFNGPSIDVGKEDPSSDDNMSANDGGTIGALDFNTSVTTPYGDGKMISFREADGMFQVELAFGTLYAVRESLSRRSPGVEVNVAFDSLETMRKFNHEIECSDLGVECNHELCTTCVVTTAKRKNGEKPKTWFTNRKPIKGTSCLICGSPTCVNHQSAGFKKQKIVLCQACESLFALDFSTLLNVPSPTNDANTKETASNDRKDEKEEDKVESEECKSEKQANDESTESTASNDTNDETTPDDTQESREQTPIDTKLLEDKIRQLVDIYDRVMLLLAHASQFMAELEINLVAMEYRTNRIGLGTSSAGVLSGALGLAGAATIMTPFAPIGIHMLMASLAFSGSSAAVSLGTEAVNYYQRPHEAADRIIAMHGMVSSLLMSFKTLRSVAVGADPSLLSEKELEKNEDGTYINTVEQGLSTIRQAQTSIGLASMAASSSTSMAAAAPGATSLINSSASVLSAVPLLGAALSGMFIAMDANRLQATLSKINAGDPSAKATALQKIHGDLLVFPQTVQLDKDCQTYCASIENNLPTTQETS